MPRPASNDPPHQDPQPLETPAAPAELRNISIDAVHQVNAQFLDLLCAKAGSTAADFPLDNGLRERFASLTSAQREKLGCCGTLLVDAGFSDPNRWRRARFELRISDPGEATSNHWLPREEAIFIAHSTFLVAWSVLHGSRAQAGVLLGTSPDTAVIIAELSVAQLSYVAQHHSHWIRPRWARLPQVWSDLLDFAADRSADPSDLAVLRCLQLAGGQSEWLDPFIDARA
jgi:hypothetical protein